MKKYRPYETLPDSLCLSVIKCKRGDEGAYVIVSVCLNEARVIMNGGLECLTPKDLFRDFTTLTGEPVGEAYDEAVELVHDEVYCVRDSVHYTWRSRHYARGYEFYENGRSSKTTIDGETLKWRQIALYDPALVGTTNKPKEYIYIDE